MNNKHGKWMLGSCLFLVASTSSAANPFFAADRFTQMSALPGSSLGAPSGMVASKGSAFVGIGGMNTPDTSRTDGSLTVGMGLGDSIKSVGATASVTVGSINNSDGGFGERKAVNLSVGKFFENDQIGLAIGGVNLASSNRTSTPADPSIYAAVTKVFSIPNHPVIVNFGIGSNDFVDIKYQPADSKDRVQAVSPFVSAGYYVNPHVSLIADYTALVGSIGASISPVHKIPLTITVGAYDVTGDEVSYTAALGYSFTY